MIKRREKGKQNLSILVGAGVFLIIIITLILFKGSLTKIYMMYSNRLSNDITDENIKNDNDTTKFDSSYVVAIDAGHGGNDPGTNGYGMIEKDVTLDVCQKLNAILKNSGINTLMIRDGDDYVDHIERIQYANNSKVTLYMSVHCDWFVDKSFTGIRTFYNPSQTLKSGNLLEKDYAQNIQNSLINKSHVKDMGIVPDSEISVLKRAEMPSILVEIGFLSNKNDASLLITDDYRNKTAEALAEGIMSSLKSIK